MVDLAIDYNPAHIGSPAYKDLLVVNNDLSLTADAYPNGNAPLATNPILQNILQRLQFFLGEWFLDNTQGLPFFQQILVKNPDQSKVDAIFQNAILGTPGVTQLSSYSFEVNSAKRIFSVKFTCITTTGVVSYAGNVPVTGGQT